MAMGQTLIDGFVFGAGFAIAYVLVEGIGGVMLAMVVKWIMGRAE